MSDFLLNLAHHPLGAKVVKMLGLPKPQKLLRGDGAYREKPLSGASVLLPSTEGVAADSIAYFIAELGGKVATQLNTQSETKIDALLLDATGINTLAELEVLYTSFNQAIPHLKKNARVLIISAFGNLNVEQTTCAHGIKGFTRSLAKELGQKGITVNQCCVAAQAVDRLGGVLRFFLGPQTTYVTGQIVAVSAQVSAPKSLVKTQLLAGKVALVTGSAGGIGAATAERLIQEGATVICVDIPLAEQALLEICGRIGAKALAADITREDAAQRIIKYVATEHGSLDIIVHNAGITRDRTLANMQKKFWDQVLNVNLNAIVNINKVLLESDVLNDEARIVCLSSVSGVAGNFGQCNYATSKAALIGYVQAQAELLADRGICINAVAPGFIETKMTDAMPFVPREIARRLNSLKQGGKPQDVAELITFLSTPNAYGISGQLIRVCGQSLIGA